MSKTNQNVHTGAEILKNNLFNPGDEVYKITLDAIQVGCLANCIMLERQEMPETNAAPDDKPSDKPNDEFHKAVEKAKRITHFVPYLLPTESDSTDMELDWENACTIENDTFATTWRVAIETQREMRMSAKNDKNTTQTQAPATESGKPTRISTHRTWSEDELKALINSVMNSPEFKPPTEMPAQAIPRRQQNSRPLPRNPFNLPANYPQDVQPCKCLRVSMFTAQTVIREYVAGVTGQPIENIQVEICINRSANWIANVRGIDNITYYLRTGMTQEDINRMMSNTPLITGFLMFNQKECQQILRQRTGLNIFNTFIVPGQQCLTILYH